VRLLQGMRVAVVDRLVGVTNLAHPQFLVHARVLHERVAGVPAALVQRDHRDARAAREPLEPLRHVIWVPRAPVALAKYQVVVLPGLARDQPLPELGLAVSAQEGRRVVVDEHFPLPALVLALDSRSLPPI